MDKAKETGGYVLANQLTPKMTTNDIQFLLASKDRLNAPDKHGITPAMHAMGYRFDGNSVVQSGEMNVELLTNMLR